MGAVAAKAQRFATAVREVRHDKGSTAALKRAAGLLVAAADYRARLYSEWRFDRRHNIDTRGVIPMGASLAASAAHADGQRYQSTRPRDFERLVRSLPLELPPSDYTFIDLGCGKGRVLVLAACHGFKRVVGVELDGTLVAVARANLQSVRPRSGTHSADVEVVTTDAAGFSLPQGPVIVYMYNPFGEQTIRDVASNLQCSLEQQPRPMLVIYYNPVHEHLLEEVPALKRVPSGADFWRFYSAR